MKIRICECCGRPYEVSKRNQRQKYCSRACNIKMQNRHLKEKRANARKRRAEQEQMKSPRKGVSEIAAEARAAGMSYGKYQAMRQAKKIRVDIGGEGNVGDRQNTQ